MVLVSNQCWCNSCFRRHGLFDGSSDESERVYVLQPQLEWFIYESFDNGAPWFFVRYCFYLFTFLECSRTEESMRRLRATQWSNVQCKRVDKGEKGMRTRIDAIERRSWIFFYHAIRHNNLRSKFFRFWFCDYFYSNIFPSVIFRSFFS